MLPTVMLTVEFPFVSRKNPVEGWKSIPPSPAGAIAPVLQSGKEVVVAQNTPFVAVPGAELRNIGP